MSDLIRNDDFFIINRGGLDYRVKAEEVLAEEVEIPDSLHPMGFINVADPAPSDPDIGDLYIQFSNGAGAVTADLSFSPGITGDLNEGIFVMYGADGQWHAGGDALNTQVQADWNETDIGAFSFINNKPNIDQQIQDYVGDGKLTINNSDGSTAGEFTANQSGDTTISLPAGFSGDYNDLTNVPAGFSGDYNDLTNLPVIGDGTITITEHDGTNVGEFTVNQEGDVTITLPEIDIPEALHPKGFINVGNPAPATPEHGDIYIQYNDDNGDVAADASFAPGITGTIEEGVFVIYGTDDEWHAGGQSAPTQMQSDWDEIDTGSPAFILNKPDIDQQIQDNVGDGKLTINNSDGSTAGEFTANQTTNTTISLPAGFSGDYDDLTNKPPASPPPNDGKLTIKDSNGNLVGEFTADQAGDTTLELPDGFPEAPGDGELYVRNGQTEGWVRGLPYDLRTLPDLP